jgi:uncharacterized protein YdcH (DUF465 family)
MNDALPNDPTDVKDVLLRTNEDFRQLASEHHELDERIQQLARLAYLTDQQQYEEISLKKRKLALKDRMAEIMRQPLPRH